MSEEWQIKGKNFLLTGGASGIGAKKLEALLNEGAEAVAILDVDEDRGRVVAEQLNIAHPNKVTFIKCDMANNDSVTRAFDQVLAKLHRIDAIINNAGILDDSPDRWRSSVDINVKGVIALTMLGISHMSRDKGGRGGTIVNVSSVGAFIETDSVPIYCATKGAVMWFSMCISGKNFFEITGVRVMTICYGGTDTPILNANNKTYDKRCEKVFTEHINSVVRQRPESAAKGCMDMLKKGSNGSIWLSIKDKPVEDITMTFKTAYKMIQDLIRK